MNAFEKRVETLTLIVPSMDALDGEEEELQSIVADVRQFVKDNVSHKILVRVDEGESGIGASGLIWIVTLEVTWDVLQILAQAYGAGMFLKTTSDYINARVAKGIRKTTGGQHRLEKHNDLQWGVDHAKMQGAFYLEEALGSQNMCVIVDHIQVLEDGWHEEGADTERPPSADNTNFSARGDYVLRIPELVSSSTYLVVVNSKRGVTSHFRYEGLPLYVLNSATYESKSLRKEDLPRGVRLSINQDCFKNLYP